MPVADSPGRYVSQDGTLGYWSTEAPDDFDWSGSVEGFWPVSRLRQAYIDYLSAKQLEYSEQQMARHYYAGSQWTPEEIRVLRNRRQPVITFNRSARKIDQIVGLVQRMRQDPKAYPRNPRNADGAEIATQCVRSVLDASDWEFVDPYCAGQAAIEGIGGVELKLVDGDHDDPDLVLEFVFGDDFFYDPRSFKPDFTDARYMGIAKWLDVEAAVELFPDKEDELRTLMVETGFDLTTHADREFKWIYTNEKRLRLVEIWYRYKGKWFWAFFCSMILLAQGESPFLDQRNQMMNRFIMFSAFVDHDGDRYGFSRNLKGPQDELNQRRSKALFMSNVTRLIGHKGAVDNVETARREYARPDGYVEVNPGFEPPMPADKQNDLAQQLALMQDARQEIETFANIQPDLLARDIPGDHSGVAINMLQRAGISELGSYLRNYKAWKKRVYRSIWNIVQRTWTGERFVRVTANDGLSQFIQLNQTIMPSNEYGQPIIVNAVGNLDVEITMDESPDEANIMQDAYDVLKGYPPGTVPPAVLIELSPLQSSVKQRVMALLNQPPDPMLMQAKQLALGKTSAETDEIKARAERHRSQSVSDAARAAHLGSEANLNSQELFQQAQAAAQGQMPGAPGLQPSPPQNFGPLAQPGAGGPGVLAPGQAPPIAAPPARARGGPVKPGQALLTVAHDHPILRQARQAADGNHYVPDPRSPGRYLRVA
jgi:hypothetical protein